MGRVGTAILLVYCLVRISQPVAAGDIDGDGVDDSIDFCCNTPSGAPISRFGSSLGDFDYDCDLDAGEAIGFLNFFGQTWSELPVDFDGDNDVDLLDFSLFQRAYQPDPSGGCCAEQLMAYGESVDAENPDFNSWGRFCFEAAEGDWISLCLEVLSGGPQLLSLRGPYYVFSYGECAVDCGLVQVGGVYYITVTPVLAYLGSFRLHLTRCRNEESAILEVNVPVHEHIGPGERDVFAFDAESGLPYTLEWASEAPNQELTISIRASNPPYQQFCDSTCSLSFPILAQARAYSITVDGRHAASGDYQLQIKTSQ